jgi:hypothetical protein
VEASKEKRINELQTQLADAQRTAAGGGASNAAEALESELQNRVKAMADNLLSKTAQLERLAAERASLRVQFENESQRVASLEKQLRQLRERRARDDDSDFGTSEDADESGQQRRRGGGGAVVVPGISRLSQVQRAVGFLDSLGSALGAVLRRYPTIRLLFVVYVLLIHLWVVYVLNHFNNHSERYSQRVPLPGPAVDAFPH